jgi:F0F1-type ATP synthase assembly protein I
MSAKDTFPTPPPKRPFSYGRYLGMGLQLVAYVLFMALVGHWIDDWQDTTKPYYTAGSALLGVMFAIIHLIRSTRAGKL